MTLTNIPQKDIVKMYHKRFLTKFVVNSNGCWEWKRGLGAGGYGQFYDGKVRRAHRHSYEYFKGKIPKGLVLDHLCRVRNCINPEHLEIVTSKENILRGIGISALNKKKKICKRGHKFIGKNVIYYKKDGKRECRKCKKILGKEYRAKVKNIKKLN